MAKGKTVVDKFKRKSWLQIVAPAIFENAELSETVAEKPEMALGRVIRVSMDFLSDQPKLRYIKVNLKIAKIEGNKALCEVAGHQVDSSYLGRMVRRKKSKIGLIADVATQDKVKVRLGAVILCQGKIERGKQKEIRRLALQTLQEEARKKNFDEFIRQVLFGEMVPVLFKNVKHLAPLKRIEISQSKLLKG